MSQGFQIALTIVHYSVSFFIAGVKETQTRHSERGVARTSGLLLDNGMEHESLNVLHKQVTSINISAKRRGPA
jgi:hypothetical protein